MWTYGMLKGACEPKIAIQGDGGCAVVMPGLPGRAKGDGMSGESSRENVVTLEKMGSSEEYRDAALCSPGEPVQVENKNPG